MTLTPEGERIAREVAAVEEKLYATIDELVAGTPVSEALAVLRAFAEPVPAGRALARRARKS